MDVDAMIDYLNHHPAHAQKAVWYTFRNKFVALVEHLWTLFQQEAATLNNSVDEATRDVALSSKDEDAHCQSTVQKHLERSTGQGGAQGRNSLSSF